MTTYLAVLAFLLLFMFFIEREKKGFLHFTFQEKYRKIIILGVLGLIPLLVVQLFIPRTPKDKGAFYERLTNGKYEIGHINYELEGLEYKCRTNPSYENFIDYFSIHDKSYAYNCQELRAFIQNSELKQDKETILLAIAKTICETKAHTEDDLNITKTNQPGYNYSRALNFYYLGMPDSAEYYFYQEVKFTDLKTSSYRYLENMARRSSDQLKKLYLNWDAIKYLPTTPKQDYYFENGYYSHYTYAIYYDFYRDVPWLTIVIAFLVCLVWVYYVRSIDIFDRESWLNILIVFAMSWAAANLCYYGYDFFKLTLGWSLAGDNTALSDFIYCTVVIGGCEELIKLLPWGIFLVLSRKTINEPYDYLLYASISALGFAGAENVIYYERHDMAIISMRAIMSSVGHMFFACLIAYSFILMKYRYKTKKWRYFLPVIGFLAACLAHGFYDFWLLSPSASRFKVITLIFFIMSLHIWKNFKNNALNNSTHYNHKTKLSNDQISFILLAGFILILMIEYVVTSYQLGHRISDFILKRSSLFMAFFGLYLISTFEDFTLRKGKWEKIKWPFQDRIKNLLGRSNDNDLHGLRLRLFAPKTNQYVGEIFPITGQLIQEVKIDNADSWYIFEIDQTIHFPGYESKRIVLRSKDTEFTLEDERIENILLLIPEGMNLGDQELETIDFSYVGRTYSSPI